MALSVGSTWTRIYDLYETLADQIVPDETIPEYPGYLLQQGSSNNDVLLIQTALNKHLSHYTQVSRW